MNKSRKQIVIIIASLTVLFLGFIYISNRLSYVEQEPIRRVVGIILSKDGVNTTVEGEDEKLYIFDKDEIDETIGTKVEVEYKKDESKGSSSKLSGGTSNLESNSGNSNVSSKEETSSNNTVVDYDVIEESKIPDSWLDGGPFEDYYVKAYQKLKTLSLDEKIGQTLLARFPELNQVNEMKKYHLGGYIFFEVDFKGKSRENVINMIASVQNASPIPLLTAIDEEGGKVSRISSNPNLTSSPFKSPQDLYKEGGFNAISADVKNKSAILKGLGLNLNLAPVVDVSTNEDDYIYKRTLGLGTSETSTYATRVIRASKGTGVSYTLKHFPGYGNNVDTHISSSVDEKSFERIMNEDIPPFRAGIEAGAEAVMIAHNIVKSIDGVNEASLSKSVHDVLRKNLGFNGIVITDDISMGALKNVADVGTKAILAGNDILITTDYAKSFNEIKSSINSGIIKESELEHHVFRILAWKYYKGLL